MMSAVEQMMILGEFSDDDWEGKRDYASHVQYLRDRSYLKAKIQIDCEFEENVRLAGKLERKIIFHRDGEDWEACPDEDMPKVFEDSKCKHGINFMLCGKCDSDE